MKKFVLSIILTVLMINLVACGTESVNPEADMVSYIKVLEDGTIEGAIVEDFGESYYDVEGLKSMIQDAINEYNQKDITAGIKLISCELIEEQVKVILRYGSYRSYTGFNSRELFVGTVKEASKLGYDLDVSMLGTGKASVKLSQDELLALEKMKIVIAEEPIRVICYGNIDYYTESAALVGKKAVDMEHTQGYGVVLFE
ncbi:MAG: hypothetical protein IJ326_07855 [Lachnospiraceae bacterium]|nr:hypothetical protein [Lachnospiraceae bacterium]